MAENEVVTRYWMDHYVHKGLCSLCGNSGIVDTRGARSPAGVEVGRLDYCICPNGQAIRDADGDGAFLRREAERRS